MATFSGYSTISCNTTPIPKSPPTENSLSPSTHEQSPTTGDFCSEFTYFLLGTYVPIFRKLQVDYLWKIL